MDARLLWAGVVVILSGCAALNPPIPTKASTEKVKPAATAEAPNAAPTTQPAAPVDDELIQGYIARIDQVARKKPERTVAKAPVSSETATIGWETSADIALAARHSTNDESTAAESKHEPTADTETQTTPIVAAPPKVGGVSARSAAPSNTTETPADDVRAGVNTPVQARSGPQSLREFLEQNPVQTTNTSFREQLDARLLWIASGEYERARQPLTLVTAEQDAVAKGLIESWIALRDSHMGDLQDAANRSGQQIDQFRDALRKLGDLGLANLTICRSVRGFGQYEPIDPAKFPAGVASEFVLYCEVRDFVSEKTDDGLYETRFDLTTLILTRTGDTVLELKDPSIVDRARNRRHDCFVPRLVRLPATLAPGNYVAKISLTDKLGKKVAESRAAFQIVAGEER